MPRHRWYIALPILAALLGLCGCSGNYKFDDNEYRPLGDPQVINRGN
ncbi:type VI secretion protein [Pseudomonas schmalbachii]|uniref:Type VI secretion protein n=1 Tax=Pseudomonas schmalbachii TaxID=2816993 RepID=A0ABS3TUL4_9PSED|nr:type VI secretion protein [Pseudomonas schmalbachii]MBO3277356.1 type VI secretion protein [Pseudomonas schmalbachii]